MYRHPGHAESQTFTSRISIPQAGHTLELLVLLSVPIVRSLSKTISSGNDAYVGCLSLLDLGQTHSPEKGNAINMALELSLRSVHHGYFSCNGAMSRASAQTSLPTATSSTGRFQAACVRPSCSVNVTIAPLEPRK
jgi:hypothetical protein